MKRLLLMLALLCGVASGQSLTGSITATGATCATTAACVDLQMPSGDAGSATILVTGTWVATLQFEASVDGITYAAINFTPPNSTTAVTSASANGTWQGNVAGYKNVRVRCSAFTSGTAVVTINSSKGTAKSSGGGSSLPALSDNGTLVTSTEPIVLPNGTIGAPSIEWVESGANAGFARVATNAYDFSIGNSTAAIRLQASNTAGNLVINKVFGIASNNVNTTAADVFVSEKAAGSLQFGIADAAAPVAQTMGPQSVVAGTSNTAGQKWTLRPSLGTGNALSLGIGIQRALMLGSGSTQQSAVDAIAVGPSKTLSNTSATAQSLANISVPSNSAGGVAGFITVTCTDGTNFDSETQSLNVSYVNKAGTLTVGTPAITTSTAANNSGSCTAGITAVAGTNSIDIKVTPVFTTIVPTTVTSYIEIHNHGTGNVTFN